MVELVVRLVLAASLVGSSILTGSPEFELAWRVASLFAAVSVLAVLLDRRGLRNSGVAGIVAVMDAGCIAFALSGADLVTTFGFLVLAPCAFATARFGSHPAAMAPIAASAMLAAENWLRPTPPGPMLLAQTAAVLVVGLLLNQSRIVVTVTQTVKETSDPLQAPVPHSYFELRENFRKLRDHCLEIERKSRRHRLATLLHEAMAGGSERKIQSLAHRMRELAGTQGLTLYTVATGSGAMTVTAASGELPKPMETSAIDLMQATTDTQILLRANEALRSLSIDRGSARSVVLKDRNRVVGLVALSDDRAEGLAKGLEIVGEASAALAALVAQEEATEALARRLRETETLYQVSTIVCGADTPTALAARIVRELWEPHSLDHLAIWFLDEDRTLNVASEGATCPMLDAMRVGQRQGIEAWLANGATELVLHDAASDGRFDRVEVLKRRVGSWCLVPLEIGGQPYGFITAATHRVGGVQTDQVEFLRVLAAELGQAIGRLASMPGRTEGLATPKEFQESIRGSHGCLVHLEPIRKEELVEQFGSPAFDHAVRSYARRLRTRLPSGGLLCRRPEGDYVAFLRDCAEPFALSWANEAAATASLVAVRTPDGRARIPLAFRAKVSVLGSQTHLIHDKATAIP